MPPSLLESLAQEIAQRVDDRHGHQDDDEQRRDLQHETAPLFKTFYIARPAALPDDDVTARFARSLMFDLERRDHRPADGPSG